jgi:hypothetical protein
VQGLGGAVSSPTITVEAGSGHVRLP